MLGAARFAWMGGSGPPSPTIESVADSTTDTASLTVTSGTRLAVLVVTEGSSSTHDAVSYGASSLSLISSGTAGIGSTMVTVSWWELGSPTAGTDDVVVTTSDSTDRIGVVAYSLVGAGPAQAGTGTSGTNSNQDYISASITVAEDDSLVLDGVGFGNYATIWSPDSPQYEEKNFYSGGSSTANRARVASSSRTADTGTIAMAWTRSSGTSLRHRQIAIAFPPGEPGEPPEPNPKIETLVEDFEDNTLPATLEDPGSFGSPVFDSGEMELVPPLTIVRSKLQYDLTGSAVVLDFHMSGSPVSCVLRVVSSGGHGYVCSASQVYVDGSRLVANSPTGIGTPTEDYDSSDHRYLRIREASGTIYIEAGPDLVNWTTIASEATDTNSSFNPAAVTVEISGADSFVRAINP